MEIAGKTQTTSSLLWLVPFFFMMVGCAEEACRWNAEPQPSLQPPPSSSAAYCDGLALTSWQVGTLYITQENLLAIDVVLYDNNDEAISNLRFTIDPQAEDGSYPISSGAGDAAVRVGREGLSGTLAFRRSRDVPFLDRDAAMLTPGETYVSRIAGELSIEGTFDNNEAVALGSSCAEVRLDLRAMEFSLENSGEVIFCEDGADP